MSNQQLLLPEGVKEKLKRLYDSRHQNWLSSTDADAWPLRIKLGAPTEREAAANPSAVKAWIAAWRSWHGPGEVSWSDRRWRSLGTQCLPQEISFTGAAQVARWIGENSRWERAEQRFLVLKEKWPVLLHTLPRFFAVLADYSDADIARLTSLLEWFETNTPVRLYPRQIPVSGVDTKWLERHTGIITKLLSVIQDKDEDNLYKLTGLTRTPKMVRFRILDRELRNCFSGLSDITCTIDEFARLSLSITRAFLVENDQTALCFHDFPGAIVIFSRGYSVEIVEAVPWLLKIECYYWGDLDTHGFNILNSARSQLPHLKSLLMDEETLKSHRDLWVVEEKPIQAANLKTLSAEEHNLYLAIRDDALGTRVRLEQERIDWEFAWERICNVLHTGSTDSVPPAMPDTTLEETEY
ncbi:MAG: hypothetical protein K2X81_10270 [Candidatus Obscuribacterales bacterium]|nr:hypothetical protein [Candidatus Obscuribacterales bacterium]